MTINWPDLLLPPINLWSAWRVVKMETPCKKECLYDPDKGYCMSCGRTLEDLSLWLSMTKQERKKAMILAKERIHE